MYSVQVGLYSVEDDFYTVTPIGHSLFIGLNTFRLARLVRARQK